MSQEEVQPIKRKRSKPKFLTKSFVFGICLFFYLCAFFALYLLDSSNIYRPKELNVDFFLHLLKLFGIEEFNVGITSWFLFMVCSAVGWVAYLLILIYLPIKHHLENKHEREFTKKGNVIYTLVIILIGLIILGGAGVLLYFFFPWHYLNWKTVSTDVVLNLVESFGILVAFFVCILLALVIVIAIFKLIILLIAGIGSSVSKSVMSSSNYLDFKAAADYAAADRRKKAGLPTSPSGNGGSGDSPHGEYLFPALTVIDDKWDKKKEEEIKDAARKQAELEEKNKQAQKKGEPVVVEEVEVEEEKHHFNYDDLTTIAYRFQSFLCKRKYYFPIDILRSFIAGLSCSRLILLEGLSGTGKTTLPRMFLEFCGGKAYFFPVQATWRDRSDITGYYSDFTGEFKETELLKHLYEAVYTPSTINLMVLDEMNISRVEYYFADFLSIFEYPSEDWLVPLMQVKLGTPVPHHLEGGAVRIQTNTWFVGTVNIDDSTFTITDKVYDRAIVIDFKEINLPFTSNYNSDPLGIETEDLNATFDVACNNTANSLSEKQRIKFLELCSFCADTFDIRFGNRIMNQIDRFLPVFVAMGGTKEAALDIMFARKILRKLDGKFESYIKDGLAKLSRYINSNYGKGVFTETEALIEKFRKKLS